MEFGLDGAIGANVMLLVMEAYVTDPSCAVSRTEPQKEKNVRETIYYKRKHAMRIDVKVYAAIGILYVTRVYICVYII